MLATLALMTAMGLSPAQAGELKLTNVRAIQGLLGPERKSDSVLPGDRYIIAFDIDGIKAASDGKYYYSMGMEVTDAAGKSQYKQQPEQRDAFNSLGGSQLPAFAHLDIGIDLPKGDYTLTVTVNDLVAKTKQMLTRKFTVLPRDFGLVRPQTTIGETPVPPLGVPGQEFILNFYTVGFQRDATKKQPNLLVEMTVYDENGQPTLAKPFTGEVMSDVPERSEAIPMQFLLKLNRAGKYTVELKATDRVTNKTAKLVYPVTVISMK